MPSDWNKIQGEKWNKLLILAKVAAKYQLLDLLFRNDEGEN